MPNAIRARGSSLVQARWYLWTGTWDEAKLWWIVVPWTHKLCRLWGATKLFFFIWPGSSTQIWRSKQAWHSSRVGCTGHKWKVGAMTPIWILGTRLTCVLFFPATLVVSCIQLLQWTSCRLNCNSNLHWSKWALWACWLLTFYYPVDISSPQTKWRQDHQFITCTIQHSLLVGCVWCS